MNKLIHRVQNGYTSQSFSDENPVVVVTPLPYWFSCGDSGLALPIDAIQADAVKLFVRFNDINSLYTSSAHQSFTNTNPVAGEAYFPLSNSPFYRSDYRDWETDRKSTRLNSSHSRASRMPSSA